MEKDARVDEKNYYSRLDTFIRKNFPEIKLGAIYSLIRRGFVKVNGKRVRKNNYLLNIGDTVKIILDEDRLEDIKRPVTPSLKARPMNLDIIYEDKDFLVINKPPKVSVHPGNKEEKVTIIEGVMYYSNGEFEPHLVHRLDKLTSGVMIIAKSKQTARDISHLIKSRESQKFYIALLVGELKNKKGKLTSLVDEKEAYLKYEIIEKFKTNQGTFTLVGIELLTGRKHQIRVQFADAGYPVAGDDTYGDREINKILKKNYNLKRFFLHANKISFNYNGTQYEFIAPLSQDLQIVLARLKEDS